MDNFGRCLYKACYAVAKETMFEMKPIDVNNIENLAMVFYSEANEFRDLIEENRYDPRLLIRAVSYLAHTHTHPSSRRDSAWFRDQLTVIIEMACPNVIQTNKSAEFFEDILKGIRLAKEAIK